MPITKEQKQEIIAELEAAFKEAKSLVFADYRGLSVKDISKLRRDLRAEGVTFKVAKKTLMKIAAEKAGLEGFELAEHDGPVAVSTSPEDPIAPARILYKFSKDNENVSLLGAYFDGENFDQIKVKELATIPSQDILIGKLIGSMQAPVYGFYNVLRANLQGLHTVLSAIVEQGGGAPEEAKEEPKEEKAEEKPAEEEKEETPTEEAKAEVPAKEEKAEEETK